MSDNQQLLYCADKALCSLQKAQKKLYSAHNMGVFDIWGGGLLTSMAKHGDLNEANYYLQEAKQDLEVLKDQMGGVDLQIDLGSGLKAIDIWLDNIFIDLTVQDKIYAAQKQVNQAISQLQSIIAKLKD